MNIHIPLFDNQQLIGCLCSVVVILFSNKCLSTQLSILKKSSSLFVVYGGIGNREKTKKKIRKVKRFVIGHVLFEINN